MLYRFGRCELDTRQHTFRRDGALLALEPQVFGLLKLFVCRAGDLITHEDMAEAVWKGRIVSDATVSSRIAAVRRMIGDDGQSQSQLQTVPKLGFRFVAPVEEVGGAPEPKHAGADAEQVIRVTRSTDGTAIAFATVGSGPPLLRAGHFLTHLEDEWRSPIWRPFLKRLSTSFTLTRYDQRGTGLSEPSPPSLALERMCDDLEAVADAAGLDRFPIFAASQGVPIAIAFAAKRPHRVSRLVLYGGYAQGRTMRGDPEELRMAEAILTLIRRGWGQAGGAFAAAFATTYMPDATGEQLRHLAKMQLTSATPASAAALRSAIDCYDVTADLERVRAPALVIHASEDAVHPVSQARLLAARLPDARLHVLDGRNHIPLPTDPCWEELLSATERFLLAE